MYKKLSTQLYKLINTMEKNSTNTIGAFTDSESVYIWSDFYILNVSPHIYDLDIDNGKKAYLPPRAELERLADAGRGIAFLQMPTRTGGNALEYWLPTQYTTLKAK